MIPKSNEMDSIFARVLKHKLAIVLLLAALLRIGVLIAFPDIFAFSETGTIHGSEIYDDYALNLNETGIYGQDPGIPDATVPPLYGYSLAIVYAIGGRGYMQVALFHILLDLLTIWLVFEISKHLFRSVRLWDHPVAEWVGALAGLFYAFYPYLIFQNLTLIDTPLFMFILHLFIFLMILLRERERLDWQTWLIAVVAGIILGLSALLRPIVPPLAIFLAIWFLFRLSFIQTLLRLLPVAVISVLILLPWIARNYDLYDRFVLTTTSGANFWQGNSEWTIPVFQAGYDVQWTAPDRDLVPSTNTDPEADSKRMELALQFWRDNPEVLPELFWTKLLVHWSIDVAPRYNPQFGEEFILDENGELFVVSSDGSIAGVTDANTAYDEPIFDQIGRGIHQVYFGSLLLLAMVGIGLSLRYWREVSLLWFVQISMTLIYVIFHPSTRYRVPTDPLLFVFSAYALIWLWFWWRQRRTVAPP